MSFHIPSVLLSTLQFSTGQSERARVSRHVLVLINKISFAIWILAYVKGIPICIRYLFPAERWRQSVDHLAWCGARTWRDGLRWVRPLHRWCNLRYAIWDVIICAGIPCAIIEKPINGFVLSIRAVSIACCIIGSITCDRKYCMLCLPVIAENSRIAWHKP